MSDIIGHAITGSNGTSHSIAIPDGCDVSGRFLMLVVANDLQATTDIPTDLVALGFTNLASDVWVDGYEMTILIRRLDGNEGYTGTSDTIDVTTTGDNDVVVTAVLIEAGTALNTYYNDGAGDYWDASIALATADPGSLDKSLSWTSTDDVYYQTFLVGTAAITGDPSGYTNLGSANPDTTRARASWKTTTSVAAEDPSTYTCASPSLCYTVALRGVTGPHTHTDWATFSGPSTEGGGVKITASVDPQVLIDVAVSPCGSDIVAFTEPCTEITIVVEIGTCAEPGGGG